MPITGSRKMRGLLMTVVICSVANAQLDPATAPIVQDIGSKIGKVTDFTAVVETREEAVEGGAGPIRSSALEVSRLYGWRMVSEGPEGFTLVTDFNTFYQYIPMERKVIKTTAEDAEMKAMLIKPVTDMNPLSLLDPKSLNFVGEELLNGETVYRVKGTTESQMMPGGPLVTRNLDAWLSVKDGLPRKTVESIGVSTGTTVYKNVQTNVGLLPEKFKFTPPENVSVIDANAEIRKMKEGLNKPASTPAASKP